MELGALFKNEEWSETRVASDDLASIIAHLLRKQITGRTAKLLLSLKFLRNDRSVEQIIADEGWLLQPLTRPEYVDMARGLLEEKPDIVKDIVEKGQEKKVKWFVGQMIARGTEGSVEPGTAEEVLREVLKLPPAEQK